MPKLRSRLRGGRLRYMSNNIYIVMCHDIEPYVDSAWLIKSMAIDRAAEMENGRMEEVLIEDSDNYIIENVWGTDDD